VSVLNLQAGGSGGFHGDRGSWLVEARRGTADLLKELLGNTQPQYADVYAKMEYRLGRRNGIAVNLLYSDDRFTFEEVVEDDSNRTNTSYGSDYIWLTHRAVLGGGIYLETVLSRAALDHRRHGETHEEDVEFEILDSRETTVLGLRQSWSFRATPDHLIRWGFESRRFDTEYDYAGNFVFDNPLAAIRHAPEEGETIFAGEYDESHTSLYLADRMRLTEAVTLELGLRHDRHSLTDQNHFSPRLNLAWAPDDASVFRFAIGTYYQSQRPYELKVQDNERAFHATELSEHRVLGYERKLRGGVTLRAELYERTVPNPRPRYENLFEALNTFPEVEPDRVRIAPSRSIARGVELFIRGKAGARLEWWANYAYASTEDEIAGVRVPRKFDQRHTFNLDLNCRAWKEWKINLAWRYHSGWPTTALWLEEEDDGGETIWVPVLGPLYGERLPAYHRLDMRASRGFRVGGGALILFFDVQNLYDRKNIAGSDNKIDGEEGTIETEIEYWAGILPSVGITYEF
jgi:outer membrane receptor protein involved in Fe transport